MVDVKQILDREDVRKTVDMVREIATTIANINACRSRVAKLMQSKSYSIEIPSIRVTIECDKTFKSVCSEIRMYSKPSTVELGSNEIYVYDADRAPGKAVKPLHLIRLNNMGLRDLLILVAYEKHCKALTKLVERLEEYEKRFRDHVTTLKEVSAVVSLLTKT